VTPQAQRKPDLENAVEDRVNADDVEQRQRAGPGLNHQNQSEDDREHAARDQQPLVLDLLAQPDRIALRVNQHKSCPLRNFFELSGANVGHH